MKAFPFLLLTCLASATQADVYRCTKDDGKTAYQEKPCEGGKALDISSAGPPTDHLAAAAASGKVKVGMTADQVRHAWGNPTSINPSFIAGHSHEQWVYRFSIGRAQYIYFTDGSVTSWN